jgi:hypothetical protein
MILQLISGICLVVIYGTIILYILFKYIPINKKFIRNCSASPLGGEQKLKNMTNL